MVPMRNISFALTTTSAAGRSVTVPKRVLRAVLDERSA